VLVAIRGLPLVVMEQYLRLLTYCPKPRIVRLNLDRFECNMCLTWSFTSALSCLVHPCSEAPSGSTAYRDSLSCESMVARVAVVPSVSDLRNRGGAVCSSACASRRGASILLMFSRLSVSLGRRRRLYVGRRLSQGRLGMKSEFWTLVREVRVATSGSDVIS
jgi:hypothetical protein